MFSNNILIALCFELITINCQNLANIGDEFTQNDNNFLKNFYGHERILSGGVHTDDYHENSEHQRYGYDEPEFYIFLLISLFLCSVAGVCSGLTVGYLSIDELTLQIKMKSGTADEKRAAAKIMPLIQKHHILLSTLLIANALALESLPIFLEATVPGSVAIVVSTVLVVIFGEILPQAFCTGPKRMEIAEKMAGLMKFLICLFAFLAYPLGAFLDWLLGIHGATRFPKRDLKALIELHKVAKKNNVKNEADVPDNANEGKTDRNHENPHSHHISEKSGLREEEVEMITGTIDLRDKKVTKIMIDIEKVFMLSTKEKFTKELIKKINLKSYSRIPIYEGSQKNKIIGCLKSKTLLENNENILNHSIMEYANLQPPLLVSKDTNLFELLMIFQDKKTTLGFITDEIRKNKKEHVSQDEIFFSSRNLVVDSKTNSNNILGIVSLRDIFEEILNKELRDDDIHKSLPQQQPVKRDFLKPSDNVPVKTRNLRTIPEESKEGR